MTLQRFAVRLTIPAMLASVVWASPPAPVADSAVSYKLLATNKTKTIRKEMNEAAAHGYKFSATMAGETLGGSEVVVVMSKPANAPPAQRYEYELLATNKTSTMQKEMRQAGAEGFRYCGQSVAETTFGGREVVVILEREIDNPAKTYTYPTSGHKPNQDNGKGTQPSWRGRLSPDGPHRRRDHFRRPRVGLNSNALQRRIALTPRCRPVAPTDGVRCLKGGSLPPPEALQSASRASEDRVSPTDTLWIRGVFLAETPRFRQGRCASTGTPFARWRSAPLCFPAVYCRPVRRSCCGKRRWPSPPSRSLFVPVLV